MNGAASLVKALINGGVEVCFANPGTSEMHFVAALDQIPGLRCVLGLHETVVTGAADGYARMTEKPAATLLHTGPGLANGLSNLHNAKKAGSPIVNVVGEHALHHIEHDAPLTSDIQAIAAPVSHWVCTPESADALANAGAQAIAQARRHPGHISTLILPANTAWDLVKNTDTENQHEQGSLSTEPSVIGSDGIQVKDSHIVDLAQMLVSAKAIADGGTADVCMVLGGHCLSARALELADQIAQRCNVTLFAETFKTRFQRGEGRVTVREIPYGINQAIELLAPFGHVITVCAKAPVGFFAYPDKPSTLWNPDAHVHNLAGMHDNGIDALQRLVSQLDAVHIQPRLQAREQHAEPTDAELSADAIGLLVSNRIPHDAIIVEEAVTSSTGPTKYSASAAAHDWLEVCGGSIGGGPPLATGAAIACPTRQVINLQADGSGMYSLQSLWTQARERLNIITVIFANNSYAILKHELDNVQANSGEVAMDMMELDRPTLDWVSLASGMGVRAERAQTIAQFRAAFDAALNHEGPMLIEACI